MPSLSSLVNAPGAGQIQASPVGERRVTANVESSVEDVADAETEARAEADVCDAAGAATEAEADVDDDIGVNGEVDTEDGSNASAFDACGSFPPEQAALPNRANVSGSFCSEYIGLRARAIASGSFCSEYIGLRARVPAPTCSSSDGNAGLSTPPKT